MLRKPRETKRGPVSRTATREIEIDLAISEQEIADPSSEEGCIQVNAAGNKLLAARGIELDLKDPVHDQFFEYVRRALLEIYRRAGLNLLRR